MQAIPTAFIEAYRNKLQAITESVSQSNIVLPTKADRLASKVSEWFIGLPKAAQLRFYTMQELTAALQCRMQDLSPILLDAGWQRHRIAIGQPRTRQSLRVWLPPGVGCEVLPRRAPIGRPKKSAQPAEALKAGAEIG